MRITIRQLNGCLSAMQLVKMHPERQIELKKLIQAMLKNKKDCIEVPENEFYTAIVEMSKLHTNLVNVQRHNRR